MAHNREKKHYLLVHQVEMKLNQTYLLDIQNTLTRKQESLNSLAFLPFFIKRETGVQIVEHLKKENESEYSFIYLTNVAKEIKRKA